MAHDWDKETEEVEEDFNPKKKKGVEEVEGYSDEEADPMEDEGFYGMEGEDDE